MNAPRGTLALHLDKHKFAQPKQKAAEPLHGDDDDGIASIRNPLHDDPIEDTRNSVLSILLPAFSMFSLSPFHRFEHWTAQHQTGLLP